MKKKIVTGLLIALLCLCMGLLSGCFLFDRNKGDTGDTPSPSTDTGLKAPESVRLDVVEKILYVPDCSASGVTYYKVVQKYNEKEETVGKLDAERSVAENGYYAINVYDLVDCPTFDLTVECLHDATAYSGVKATFTYKDGGKIIYDKEHCSFDQETGRFTWTAVQDAVKYWVKVSPVKGFNKEYVVEDTSIVFDEEIEYFIIRPLFDTYKYGSMSNLIYLDGISTNVRYDNTYRCFRWGGTADRYDFEITENGQTITKTVSGAELAYEPVSDEITVKVTAYSSLRYPGVSEKTFSVMPAVENISISPGNHKLTWSGVEGISEYEVNVYYETGEWKKYTTTDTNVEIQTVLGATHLLGEATVKILPIHGTAITRSSDFAFTVINPDKLIKPTYTMDEENEELNVTFRSDAASVDAYTVNCTAKGEEDQVLQLKTDDFGTFVSFRLSMPLNTLSQVEIIRNFKATDGNYCFSLSSGGDDYSNWVLYAGAPEIEITKNSRLAKDKFIFKVVFPEKLKNKGSFKLKRYYDDSFITKTISDDWSYDYYVPNTSAKITVVYEEFNLTPSISAILFAQRTQKTITCLDGVDVRADDGKLAWACVEGADGYYVEKLRDGYYEEIYRGAETQYVHGINLAGKYSYRVSAFSNDPCVMENYADGCTIQKLATPTICMNAAGKLEITATDEDATIVTLLDGADMTYSDDNLRAVMTDKASATLVARCVGESTPKSLYIASDDTQTYTLHRIADVTEESMQLTVDAAQNKVTWAPVAHVSEYVCRLSRKASLEGEYTVEREYTDGSMTIDGDELREGLYSLAIKPVDTCEGRDFYLYLGDFGASTFRKDGIRAVSVTESGAGFNVDGTVNTQGDYEVSWALIVRLNRVTEGIDYSFEIGACVDLSTDTKMRDYRNLHYRYNDYEFVFSVDYHGTSDEQLSRNKTLKATERLMTVRWEKSQSIENFTGTHVRTEVGEGENTVKVTLTPDEGVSLRPFERCWTVYEKVNFSTGSWTDVDEVLGTEMTVNDFSGDPYGNCFFLRVESDRFVEENGKFVYYMSSQSTHYYKVTVQNIFHNCSIYGQETEYVNPEKPEPDKVRTSCEVRLTNIKGSDTFDVEYCNDKGVWTRLYTNHEAGKLDTGIYKSTLYIYSSSDFAITGGKEIKLRLRHCGQSETYSNYGTITYEDANWQYYSFTAWQIS